MPALQVVLAAGDQVADVDRLTGPGVRHEAVVGVLVLPVEDVGEGPRRAGQRGMGRHVVHPLAAEPHLTAPAAQARQELLAGPRSHALPYSAAVPVAAPSARQTRSGVRGMSMWRTPRWESASMTAFCTAGMAPMVPDSPKPLAPSGLT